MKNFSELVLSGIHKIMIDCAKGKFSDDYAIQKIKAVVDAYTVYKKCLVKADDVKKSCQQLRVELEEVERDFNAACHERETRLYLLMPCLKI